MPNFAFCLAKVKNKLANIVAIVGRPNVGKSTFFNRLTESREAIMDNTSGVTRDRHYAQVQWGEKNFTVVDTGGYVHGSDDTFEAAIREQVEVAIEEANIVLFMVDINEGLTDLDKEFAKVIRKYKKNLYVIANKADTPDKSHYAAEFYAMGFEEIFPVSAQTGYGTGELLERVAQHIEVEEEREDKLPRFAIVGRPNAGKSSFVNTLLNQNRTIVTEIAGTTRDSIDSRYKAFGYDIILTDTAGLRKKSKIEESIEFYSVMRAVKALEDSDVCIVLIDAQRGLESQDLNIIHLAHRYGKGIVIMVNKWDLIEKNTKTADIFKKEMAEKLAPHTHIPIIFASVLEKQRIFQTVEKAVKVYEDKNRKISTSELNEKMLAEIEHYPPPAVKGKYVKIKYITQIPGTLPTFLFFCNLPQYIKEPYQRYLENKLRGHFGFDGVPIRIFFRKK